MSEEGQSVALVTGGGTGIGAACCRALSAEGFRVGVHYRSSEEKALKLVAELPGGFALRGDLAKPEDVDALVKQLKVTVLLQQDTIRGGVYSIDMGSGD